MLVVVVTAIIVEVAISAIDAVLADVIPAIQVAGISMMDLITEVVVAVVETDHAEAVTHAIDAALADQAVLHSTDVQDQIKLL
jgi:hypothetical protein